MADTAQRTHPLQDRMHGASGVLIEPCAPAERFSLRAAANVLAPIGSAIGLTLPEKIRTTAMAEGKTALCIGPDEWLVIDESGSDIAKALAGVEGHLLSCVDISHRNTAIRVSGPKAATVIVSGCPQDLRDRAFPVGTCARTIYGKAEIVLLREAGDVWRVECWRSFSDYVWKFLVDAAKSA